MRSEFSRSALCARVAGTHCDRRRSASRRFPLMLTPPLTCVVCPPLRPVPRPSPTRDITSNQTCGARDACCQFAWSADPEAEAQASTAIVLRATATGDLSHSLGLLLFPVADSPCSYEIAALRSPFYSTSLNFYTLGNKITKADYDKPPAHFSKTVCTHAKQQQAGTANARDTAL